MQDITGGLRKEVSVIEKERADKQFLDRYGDHLIPVENAQSISDSASRRQTKRYFKAQKVDAALEEDLDGAEPTIEDVETASVAAEFSEDELDNIVAPSNKVQGEKIQGQKFVKFSDILPPTPPRGEFDVNRIRESAYFFS